MPSLGYGQGGYSQQQPPYFAPPPGPPPQGYAANKGGDEDYGKPPGYGHDDETTLYGDYPDKKNLEDPFADYEGKSDRK